MVDSEEAKRIKGRAEECLALADAVGDRQAQEAYRQMAEAYLMLAGGMLAGGGLEKPRLISSKSAKTRIRRRLKQTISLKDRLGSFANEMREKAARLRPGAEQEALLKRARLADTALHLRDWANSSGLQPPR
jgi:hypothetical protein